MRPIKFRAWDSDRKLIVTNFSLLKADTTPQYIIGITDEGIPFAGTYDDNGDWIDLELMQFTGLHDRNGREIYEGDVVKYKTFYYGKEKEHIRAIKWEEWDSDDFGQPHCAGFRDIDTGLEVIGNIYEK